MVKCFKFLFLNIIFLQVSAASLQSHIIEPKFDVLPVVTPRCIFQDSFGFIWIGTFGGMVRYDGYTLKQYSNIPYDSTSLSNNWVFAIDEDKNGNLWIGTYGGGLNYFDRRTEIFTHYNGQTMDSMSNSISSILVNEDGSLWLGSGTHGLIWFSKDPAGKVRYLCYPITDKPAKQLISNNIVLDLHQDKEGLIWIASAMEGLIKFNTRTREMIKFKHDPANPKSISCNTISCICEDEFGNLWMGTGNPTFPPAHGSGLNMYNRKTGEFKHFTHNAPDKNGLCSNSISSLLIDHSGTMWIGSWDNYLNSVSVQDLLTKENPEFTHYTNLARDMVISLYEDRLYNIWIGVFGMELYKIDQQQKPFTFYGRTDKFPDCLTHSDVVAICVDHSGRVWFGTRGLDGYDPRTGQYTHYYSVPGSATGLSDNWIAGIQEDDDGQLWIATRNSGINIFNPENGSFKHLQHHEDEIRGLIDNSVRHILKRPNGDFWIATSRATIQLYEKKTGRYYNYDLDNENERDLDILALCEDRDGVLWIGTMNSGMYSLKTESNKLVSIDNYRYNPKDRNSLSNIEVTDILHPEVIDTNSLWLATIVGLNRFDMKTKKFTHIFRKDGLASDLVLRVLEDNDGNIWCATIDGISVYDIHSGKIKSYGKGDGMPFTDFSNIGKNSAKGPDGQLFFGGVSGALSFYPEQLNNNPNIPPIALTDFKIFQKSAKLDTAIQFKKLITLSHHQNAFSFDFAALNFTNPEKNQYEYKMEGFHDDWINIGHARTVSFTNLEPGKYAFHVKGSNNHGVWNEEGASIRIIITPPWWQTSGAYIAYTILLGTILIGTVRFEVRRRHRKIENQLRREQELRKLEEAEHRVLVAELERKTAEAQREAEKEQMRSRIASDLHDEIGGNLSSIALIGQVLQDKLKPRPPLKKKLQEIPRIARLTAESMRDIVWFINPENDDMDKLLTKMRETANLMLETTDFSFTVPQKGISQETDLNFRRNLYLIYKECLQNIIKHSQAQKAEIELREVDRCLILSVKDNGVGFDTGREYSGNGLKNLQRRAVELRGKLAIVSEAGKGTSVEIMVKIDSDNKDIS